MDSNFVGIALLLALSLFFELAFEEFHAHAQTKPPGGIRTFPLLALAGALLFRIDTANALPFSAGLLILGAWLFAWFWRHSRETEGMVADEPGLVVPICNILAYLLGPVTLKEPPWVSVGVTVAAVLLLTSRDRLHALARRVEHAEIVTAGKFLIITGIVLPLLPDHPVTSLTPITPQQVWLAVLAICTVSYASYLLQRGIGAAASDLVVTALGGLYSSTVTTVVLARKIGQSPATSGRSQAGIIVATGIMYLRVLAVVAVFNVTLAVQLAPAALALAAFALGFGSILYRRAPGETNAGSGVIARNPLELSTAFTFTALFVAISLVSHWVRSRYGALGLNVLAAMVGVSDIDPFVLSLAQGGAVPLAVRQSVIAILIATASNNVLKAGYSVAYAGLRASLVPAAALIALAAGALAFAFV